MKRFLARKRARAGFALMEIIMALGMFTLVAFSLVLALDASLDAAKERNRVETATRCFENQFALLRGARLTPTEKDLPDDGSGLSYKLKIEPEVLQDRKKQPVYNIYRITITATWQDKGQTQNRMLSALAYSP